MSPARPAAAGEKPRPKARRTIPSREEQRFFWKTGPDQGCSYASPNWFEFTGTSWEENQGDGWAKVIHPGDVSIVTRRYERAWDQRKAFATYYRLRHWSGEYRWVRSQGKPDFESSGELIGYSGYADVMYDSIDDPANMIAIAESPIEKWIADVSEGVRILEVRAMQPRDADLIIVSPKSAAPQRDKE